VPKMKSNSGAKKRFRFTGTGKIRRMHAYHRHNFSHKSNRQNRVLRKAALVSPADVREVRRLLPYGR
jgi:large subunit ribosomal protein L35